MAVSWTPHRFSGGVLALDAANTVVLRGDPRTFDRFADPMEIARFAEAAGIFRADELGGRPLVAPEPEKIAATVVGIREATDRLFRGVAMANGGMETTALPPFLNACSKGFAEESMMLGARAQPFGDPTTPLPFETALAISALSLLDASRRARLKICRNCNWLFLDRSRNGSRLWCDMAVCGNRRKARRHYLRKRGAGAVKDNGEVDDG
jgi:predicted RNA-binding Zn ribbon-like protein